MAEMTAGASMRERTPRTRIVAIRSSNGLDSNSLIALFESCKAAPARARY